MLTSGSIAEESGFLSKIIHLLVTYFSYHWCKEWLRSINLLSALSQYRYPFCCASTSFCFPISSHSVSSSGSVHLTETLMQSTTIFTELTHYLTKLLGVSKNWTIFSKKNLNIIAQLFILSVVLFHWTLQRTFKCSNIQYTSVTGDKELISLIGWMPGVLSTMFTWSVLICLSTCYWVISRSRARFSKLVRFS